MEIAFKALGSIRKKHASKQVVFVRGSFDLIHAGHIQFLEVAKAKGDVLVVALPRDVDLTVRKGAGRPMLPLVQRKKIINAMQCVDYVLTLPPSGTREQNKEATFKILKALRPDVFVTTYPAWERHRSRMLVGYGTKLRVVNIKRINSTTALIEKAAKIYARAHSKKN